MNSPAATTRYERWPGTTSSGRWTWLAIVANGVRLGYKRQEMRFFLMMGMGFLLGPCIVFYVISLIEELSAIGQAQGYFGFVRGLLGVDLAAVTKVADFRELLWRLTFLFSFKLQWVLVLLVVATVGPGLIANDHRVQGQHTA